MFRLECRWPLQVSHFSRRCLPRRLWDASEKDRSYSSSKGNRETRLESVKLAPSGLRNGTKSKRTCISVQYLHDCCRIRSSKPPVERVGDFRSARCSLVLVSRRNSAKRASPIDSMRNAKGKWPHVSGNFIGGPAKHGTRLQVASIKVVDTRAQVLERLGSPRKKTKQNEHGRVLPSFSWLVLGL